MELSRACETGKDRAPLFKLLPAVARELERLDPRDFEPDARVAFVRGLAEVRLASGQSSFGDVRLLQRDLQNTAAALQSYQQEGARGVIRSFGFISDVELAKLIARDYRELAVCLLPGGAWKSAVVMCGSILEAIILDLLSNPSRASAVLASPSAPKTAGGIAIQPWDHKSWTLQTLIKVAGEIGLLPPERVSTFDQVLRDYRNFVHPRRELRAKHPCGEAEAMMAKGALDAVCNFLDGIIP